MAEWTMGTCEANGINVHYLRTGGNKPPLVLLHGLMASGACWTPVARALEKNYDVIMPDARGHGNSGVSAQGYLYENLAADVVCLIDALDLANPVLIGHSMGGMTAAVVASRALKRLRGLILVDPAFLTLQRQHEVHKSDVADQHLRILNGSREDFLEEILDRCSHRPPEIIELLVQARFQTSTRALEILTLPYPDYIQLIKSLDVPCLLVIGGVGSVVSSGVAAELAGLNQCLTVMQIAEAGHGIPYDQPDCLSAVVQTFLRSLIA